MHHSQCCGLAFSHKLFFTHPAVGVGDDVVVAVLSPGDGMRSSKHSKRMVWGCLPCPFFRLKTFGSMGRQPYSDPTIAP